MTSPRYALFTACVLTCCAPAGLAWSADTYPTRPVRFVVGFLPGGPSDTIARVVGSKLADGLRGDPHLGHGWVAPALLAASSVTPLGVLPPPLPPPPPLPLSLSPGSVLLTLASGPLSILTLGPLLAIELLLLLLGWLGLPPLVLTGPDVRLGLGPRWT